MDILVFKTTLSNRKRINEIEDDLDAHPRIIEWNVDLHDRDHILRVVSGNVVPGEIEKLLTDAGFYCEELK